VTDDGGMIESLSMDSGVVVSMGHSDATWSEGVAAVHHGASMITHLFNAMRPFHHREPGLLGLLLPRTHDHVVHVEKEQEWNGKNHHQFQHHDCHHGGQNGIYYSIIADGLHSHPTSIQMAYTLSKNVILVTDAISAMGLKDGIHSLGDEPVTVYNGKATIQGPDVLAGSVASMDSCIRSFQKFTGCSAYEALKTVTENPARALNRYGELGVLAVGKRADFVILDEAFHVCRTVIGGSFVYEQDVTSYRL